MAVYLYFNFFQGIKLFEHFFIMVIIEEEFQIMPGSIQICMVNFIFKKVEK